MRRSGSRGSVPQAGAGLTDAPAALYDRAGSPSATAVKENRTAAEAAADLLDRLRASLRSGEGIPAPAAKPPSPPAAPAPAMSSAGERLLEHLRTAARQAEEAEHEPLPPQHRPRAPQAPRAAPSLPRRPRRRAQVRHAAANDDEPIVLEVQAQPTPEPAPSSGGDAESEPPASEPEARAVAIAPTALPPTAPPAVADPKEPPSTELLLTRLREAVPPPAREAGSPIALPDPAPAQQSGSGRWRRPQAQRGQPQPPWPHRSRLWLLALVALVSFAGVAYWPALLSSYREAYPAEAVKSEALRACSAESATFIRFFAGERDECYRRVAAAAVKTAAAESSP